jgi:hypothetical protein
LIEKITDIAIRRPWLVIIITVLITVFFAVQFPKIKIDTDPENMLSADEPARILNHETKIDFNLYDFITVGIVDEKGVFTTETLNRIYKITAEIEQIDGVIADDILAPSTVDDIKQGEGGSLVIEPLMGSEIDDPAEAALIRSRIQDNPVLRGKLASADGQAIAIFIPIESKNLSRRIAGEVESIIEKYGGDEQYYIAGLPMAEDSFGAEMFSQMIYAAPAAMLVIFLLLLMFFRNIKIILAPMIVAMMSVIWTMGLLIMTGQTVHIMSSMIPIFLMPIAVLDSVHIISEFHDLYKESRQKESSIKRTIKTLFAPMLFTSLTTAVGFSSLALAPIPPVRVFGLFVAFGVGVAWLLSIILNPAIVVLTSEKSLRKFGQVDKKNGVLATLMHSFRSFSYKRNKGILVTTLIIVLIAGYGLTLIEVNDNPVKWFKKSHPIRRADIALNQHLAGTYMNYLVLEGKNPDDLKNPDVLAYFEALQKELEQDETVGATTALPDIVKKVRYELFGADSSKAVLPDNQDEIAQLLFLFEMSGGDPNDLYKFVTPDYVKADMWVQLKNGDNQQVQAVVRRAERFIEKNPLPEGFQARWAGMPYLNVIWQQKMVTGMRNALMGSYIVVFFMMLLLFRSVRWSFISMIPLTITIMVIYAFIGYVGKPYDMPIAVLSSLALGLSIDFAIHFIQRLRTIHKETGDFDASFREIFENTGRAISRNVLVIAIGFVPMLTSSLIPYITVGSFFLAIMIISGAVTLLLLPAIAKTFHTSLLPTARRPDAEEIVVRKTQ